MPDTRLQPASGGTGMVSSAHYLASQAGVWMLRQGGNAVDAAVCAAGTIAVVAPHLNGPGGDLFAQIWRPGLKVPVGLNASGRSPAGATIERVRALGYEMMPTRGPLTINVPGVISGWIAMLAQYGTRRLSDVLEPAIDYAEHGSPVTAKLAGAIRQSQPLIEADAGMRAILTRDGKPLPDGTTFTNRQLAKTLREVARTDGESYYTGELARRLAAGIQTAGGLVDILDFETHRCDWVEPIETTFEDRSIMELPPNTQGVTALEMLNMAERVDVRALGHNSARYIQELARCARLSYEDRDANITDPAFADIPVERLASKAFAEERLECRSASYPRETDSGDTICLCAVDSEGMAVSLIQSHYMGFGSGVMAPGTGVHFHNRGAYFSLDPEQVNRLEPRKRTMHTLIPALAMRGNQAEIVFGSMGGDVQPQIHVQILMNHLIFGMGLQAAIEAPRFAFSPSSESPNLIVVEGRIDEQSVNELLRLGHEVLVADDWSSLMGHAQAIRIDSSTGLLEGAADPRGDGAALGY